MASPNTELSSDTYVAYVRVLNGSQMKAPIGLGWVENGCVSCKLLSVDDNKVWTLMMVVAEFVSMSPMLGKEMSVREMSHFCDYKCLANILTPRQS